MAISMMVGDRSAPPPLIGLSPLAELGSQLHALTKPEHHIQDRGVPPHPDLVRWWAPLLAKYRARSCFPARAGVGRNLTDELTDIADPAVRGPDLSQAMFR